MNTLDTLKGNSHSHNFDTTNPIAKKNTLYAMLLTFFTMIIEIAGGLYYNSMALLADGWHMLWQIDMQMILDLILELTR